ncbi:hypothetical protein AJ80_05462 [Polytolypa hystricis UAMH7299]|uniref:Mitochondrial import inner membrane translocase subunit n=1 Tax=Polytolypa hystricis (strain UAMH7299) TaxID=1447883 RepID=A0A2B7XVG6_POLH7|nr:hypothetical protein AJ80_05462 [Polytolypa hystricis UAMH7299]
MSFSSPFSSSSSPGDSSSGSSSTSAEMKSAIIQQLQSESALTNARTLMEKLQENCFDKCIPNPPGSSLSSKEQTCLTTCMEKYIQLWNATSRAYIAQVGQQREKAGFSQSGDSGMF